MMFLERMPMMDLVGGGMPPPVPMMAFAAAPGAPVE